MNSNDKDPLEEILMRFKVRLNKQADHPTGSKYIDQDIDQTALAVIVASAEIVKSIRVVGTAIFSEVNALRRMTSGEVERMVQTEGGIIYKKLN